MPTAKLPKRLGFFTRLPDQADPAERYRLVTAQIINERLGFDSAWVAQHHFHEGASAPLATCSTDEPSGRARLPSAS